MRRLALLTLFLVGAAAAPAHAQIEVPPGASLVAGTGGGATDLTRGDGGLATAAGFDRISGIDYMGDGSLLVADSDDGRIRRIRPSGIISTNADPEDEVIDPVAVVGTTWAPSALSRPNGFVAVHAGLDARVADWAQIELMPGQPNSIFLEDTTMLDEGASDVEAASAGSGYFVAQPGDDRVLFVSFNALTDDWGGVPLLENLTDPRGVAEVAGGGFLVTTGFPDCRVLRRSTAGTVTVMAGTGTCADDIAPLPGNGGPATQAPLRRPLDVESTPDGGFIIAEEEEVRHVSAAGIISNVYTVVDEDEDPMTPPAVPEAIAVLPDGDVVVGMGIARRIFRFDTNYAAAAPPGPAPVPPAPPLPQPPPLKAKLGKAAYALAKGKPLKLTFTAALAGRYVLDIRKGRKLAKRVRGAVKTGRNTVRTRLKLKPGRYQLRLTVIAGTERVMDTAPLRIKRR